MEGEVRHLSLAGRFHMFSFVSIAAMAILSHFKAMTTDPGAVPPDAKPLPDPQDLEKGETGESAPQKGKRLCRRCHAFKPQRAHHCRYVTIQNVFLVLLLARDSQKRTYFTQCLQPLHYQDGPPLSLGEQLRGHWQS
jgi:hypothetical protein